MQGRRSVAWAAFRLAQRAILAQVAVDDRRAMRRPKHRKAANCPQIADSWMIDGTTRP
jgi:hypothetical protein